MTETEIKIDLHSSYYLGSSDQPGNLITHVLLKGDNYVAWSRAITLALKSQRKFGFVDGTISKPTEQSKFLNWDTVNSILVSWMLCSVDSKIASSIPYHDEARSLWLYLEKRFAVPNGPRLQQLRAAITDCKQTKGMSVEDYYNRLMGLWDELTRLKPFPKCDCGNCTCNLVGKFSTDREEEKLHQFLIGIDDDYYAAVRTNLLSQSPPLDFDKAYQAFIQEEQSRAIARGKAVTEDVHAFALQASRGKVSSDRPDKLKLFCTYCKQKGHDISNCFPLHGFPDWWYERKSGTARRGSRRTDAAVSSPSHAAVLPSPTAVSSSAPAAGSTTLVPAAAASISRGQAVQAHAVFEPPPTTSVLSMLADLRPDQVTNLLHMVNAKHQGDRMTGEFSSLPWILDTGASYHVAGDQSCLLDIELIPDCPVGLPNGHSTVATKMGTNLRGT